MNTTNILNRLEQMQTELNELKQLLLGKEQQEIDNQLDVEEPKIPLEERKWYYSADHHSMIYIKRILEEEAKMLIRYPGDPAEILVYSEEYQDMVKMDLVPDFTGMDGKQAFSVRLGMTEIKNTQASEHNHSVLEVEGLESNFTIEGRYIIPYNPEVFHNIAQCVAYFQELHLKEISEDQN